ncbi:MAG: aminoacyl-tRNA hydrolase [Patescibacteria group bacterium]
MKVKTLIVGLGNPGTKYEKTRHNVGFMVLDTLCANFKFEKKFNAEICDFGNETVLMKPQTFMNSSGKALAAFADYYKVEPKNIWVVHDEVDIPLGEIRIREGGSSAGHKGIDSVIENLGTKDFLRLRMGVKNENLGMIETEDFVLQRFGENEEDKLPKIISLCVGEIKETLTSGDRKPKILKVE